MIRPIKEDSWLTILIETYNELGGVANYQSVYPIAKRIRQERGGSWTAEAHATIRRTVEDNSKDSENFKGREVFYSVKGIGKGTWGLLPDYLREPTQIESEIVGVNLYSEGLEGIIREARYLRKSRDPRLVESRKILDDFTCQACGYRKQVGEEKFIIDVHHVNPIGDMAGPVITSIDDLICLCPNCHRIAHTGQALPLPIEELKKLVRH